MQSNEHFRRKHELATTMVAFMTGKEVINGSIIAISVFKSSFLLSTDPFVRPFTGVQSERRVVIAFMAVTTPLKTTISFARQRERVLSHVDFKVLALGQQPTIERYMSHKREHAQDIE